MLRCHFFFAITLTHINTALGTRHFTNCTTRLSFARSTTRRSMDRLFDRSSRAIVRARIFEIERAVNQNGVICKVDELHQIYNICVNHFFFLSFFWMYDRAQFETNCTRTFSNAALRNSSYVCVLAIYIGHIAICSVYI